MDACPAGMKRAVVEQEAGLALSGARAGACRGVELLARSLGRARCRKRLSTGSTFPAGFSTGCRPPLAIERRSRELGTAPGRTGGTTTAQCRRGDLGVQ